MPFTLSNPSLEFADVAPSQFDNRAVAEVGSHRVFDVLADINTWPIWFDDFKSGVWTSDPQYGLGSTRDVHIGPLHVDELMVAWEPGRRFSYAITSINLPLVNGLLADWRLTELDDGKTEVHFTIHYELKRPLVFLHPLLKGVFRSIPRKGLAGLIPFVEAKAGQH